MRQVLRVMVAYLLAISAATSLFAGAGPRRAVVDRSAPVDPNQSAALFVGVREFTHDRTLAEVRYAADDAVDLAHSFGIAHVPALIDPHRVVIALAGEPQKRESRDRLQELLAAGAARANATTSDVLALLDQQASKVGANGIFVVSFATHGVVEDGVHYLLASDSILKRRGSKIADGDIYDIVLDANVRRAFILVDACRQRLVKDARAGDSDPRSTATFLKDLADIDGRVILSAAAPGKYAYDDEVRGNGVFTAAVLDGLQCEAGRDDKGYVTVDTLSTFVEDRVLQWVRRNKDREARVATQLQCEGASKKMPLVTCLIRNGEAQGSHRE